MQHKCASLFPILPSVFHTIVTLSAPAGHLPLEGKAAMRDYHPLKRRRSHPCEPIRSPSTVIPSTAEGSLLHCRHIHTCALTQTTPWCFFFRLSLAHDLPVCKKDPSTSALMTRKKDGSSHIVFHTAEGKAKSTSLQMCFHVNQQLVPPDDSGQPRLFS